jgi:hypothetical protein
MRTGTRVSPSWQGLGPEAGYVEADRSRRTRRNHLQTGRAIRCAPSFARFARAYKLCVPNVSADLRLASRDRRQRQQTDHLVLRNITIRVIPAISEGSPWPRCWSPGRNQFQPVEALAVAGCSGYATRKMHSSAIVFTCVCRRRSCQPIGCFRASMTIKGSGCPFRRTKSRCSSATQVKSRARTLYRRDWRRPGRSTVAEDETSKRLRCCCFV